jgi:hypothetical protein
MRCSIPIVIASEAKQSMVPHKERMDCFVAEFIIGPAEGRTRWLLAMTETKNAPGRPGAFPLVSQFSQP